MTSLGVSDLAYRDPQIEDCEWDKSVWFRLHQVIADAMNTISYDQYISYPYIAETAQNNFQWGQICSAELHVNLSE